MLWFNPNCIPCTGSPQENHCQFSIYPNTTTTAPSTHDRVVSGEYSVSLGAVNEPEHLISYFYAKFLLCCLISIAFWSLQEGNVAMWVVPVLLLHSCCRDIALVIRKTPFPTMTARNKDFIAWLYFHNATERMCKRKSSSAQFGLFIKYLKPCYRTIRCN